MRDFSPVALPDDPPVPENGAVDDPDPSTHASIDPSRLGFPHMLPVELALAEDPVREICAAYGIDKAAFTKLCANPAFGKAVKDAQDMLAKEGMGFRVKARMQAEALLKTNWALIHSPSTNPAVKADLIKNTFKVAGFEPRADDRAMVMPLQINIQL
jgi:hypothetical protein